GIITLLMFMRYPGMSLGGKLAYAYVTYILWDMVYTTINIPYGSLASVITTDEKARSTLSILRSIGSGIGGVGSLILSGLCFDKVLNDRGEVVPVMNWEKLIIGVAILCGLCIICLFGCFYLTKERVPAPKIKSEKRPKAEFTKVIISLIKSRPFLSLCLASMFLITAQMFGQSYGLYLMADYFLKPEMNIVVTITQYVPMVVIIFFSNKIAAKFGKKESCGIGMLITGLAYLVLFLIKTNNVWVYLAISVIAGIGSSMFILQIWSFVNDVIDYQYVKTNKREETATYSVFSFTRKMGQTIAGVLSTQALGWALYDGESVTGQSEYTQSQLYLWATLIPAIFYLLIGLILLFWYPINKNRMQQLQIDKAKLYAKEGIDIDGIDAIVAEDSVAIKEESLESNQFEENTESEDN
ncbi:MAG TPA: MFS transporter, partial [Clostridia bacterium]|nr:MFS transporter [Clostridia bacterium]